MRILKVVKKDEENVVVHLDNDEKLFLSYEVFLKSGLRKNDEISEDHFLLLVRDNQRHFVKKRAWRYLGRRLHSVSELKLKLRQKDYDQDLIDEVIIELKGKGYLNDEQFAAQFVEENVARKLWGENKVKAELMKRGISAEIIKETLEKLLENTDIKDNAFELAKKKYNSLKNRDLEPKKLKLKLFTFLASRGYDYEKSKFAVEKLLIDSDNDEY